MTYLERVRARLEQLAGEERLRTVLAERPRAYADFGSNDYLGLATDSRMLEAIKYVRRVGSGGSRLLAGAHRDHAALEEELARLLGRERALLFSSGYLAAIGAVRVLSSLQQTAYSDQLNHASLIDGLREARIPVRIYPHAQFPSSTQRESSALIVTESLFGMDGDVADPRAILDELHDDDVLLVDEAHALGVCGPSGAGFCAGIDDPRVIVLGTLSKAFGSSGGFVAGPAPFIELLANAARTFVFDTAPALPVVLAARVGLLLASSADNLRARLRTKARRLREGLQGLGLPADDADTPIVPVILGSEARALEVGEACLRRGIIAPAIRPPTVPQGTCRLRLSLRADHTDEQIDLLLDALRCAVSS